MGCFGGAGDRYQSLIGGMPGADLFFNAPSPPHRGSVSMQANGGTYACNCMYGPTDPRCCIARAQRRLLEEAWEMGRRGEPLPEVRYPPDLKLNFNPVPPAEGPQQEEDNGSD